MTGQRRELAACFEIDRGWRALEHFRAEVPPSQVERGQRESHALGETGSSSKGGIDGAVFGVASGNSSQQRPRGRGRKHSGPGHGLFCCPHGDPQEASRPETLFPTPKNTPRSTAHAHKGTEQSPLCTTSSAG